MAKTTSTTSEKASTPVVVNTDSRYSKSEILSSPTLTSAQRLYFQLALTDDRTYTLAEANAEVAKYKKGGLF